MSRKTFWQAVVLIIIAGAVYLVASEIQIWQAHRDYEARLKQMHELQAAPTTTD